MENSILKGLRFLDPKLWKDKQFITSVIAVAKEMPTVVGDIDQVDIEARRFQIHRNSPNECDENNIEKIWLVINETDSSRIYQNWLLWG